MNKWVLAAILLAFVILMYFSVFWKVSNYGPG